MKILIPYYSGHTGGPPIFVAALSKHLKSQGHKVIRRFSPSFDVLLVIAECSLPLILYAKVMGKRIVQRLDGVYHPGLPGTTKYTYFLKNLRLRIIHNYLADHVIYQSQFAKQSCQAMLGKREKNTSIIYNGVAAASRHRGEQFLRSRCGRQASDSKRGISDEKICSPRGLNEQPPRQACPPKPWRRRDPSPLLQLITLASFRRPDQIRPILRSVKKLNIPYHLHIYGPHTKNLAKLFSSFKNNPNITYHGPKEHNQLLSDIQRYDIFLFSDQSACPNAVLEALAAGLPAVAFNRGSIPELIQPGSSGEVINLPPHNPFRDNYPFTEKSYRSFAHAILKITHHLSAYQLGALDQAQKKFNLKDTVCRRYEKTLS